MLSINSTTPIENRGVSQPFQPSGPYLGLPVELLQCHIFTLYSSTELHLASQTCRPWREVAFQVAQGTTKGLLPQGLEAEFGIDAKEKFESLLTGSALLKVQMWAAANFGKIDSFIDAHPMDEKSAELKLLFKELSILQLLLKMPADDEAKNLLLFLRGRAIEGMRKIFESQNSQAHGNTSSPSFFNSWVSWELTGCELYKKKFIHWLAYSNCYQLYSRLSEELRPLYLKMSSKAIIQLAVLQDQKKSQLFIQMSCDTPQGDLEGLIENDFVIQSLQFYETQKEVLKRLQSLIEQVGEQLSQQERQAMNEELDQLCQHRLM